MIDTVHLKFRPSSMDSFLHHPQWVTYIKEKYNGDRDIAYKSKFYINGANIYCTYRPLDFICQPLLTVNISSLPKMIFGNNYLMIEDLPSAINEANKLLKSIYWLPPIDIENGKISRIDYCFNHNVGENIRSYLDVISQGYLPHRDKDIWYNNPKKSSAKNNGVNFNSKMVKGKFYDKEMECHNPQAYGMLRQEVVYSDRNSIALLYGKNQPVLKDTTLEIARNALEKELHSLKLNLPIPGNEELQNVLFEKYRYGQASVLSQYQEVKQKNEKKSHKEIAEMIGVSYQTVRRYERQIAEAGVSPVINPGENSLPPLHIGEFKNSIKPEQNPLVILRGNTL